MGYILMTMGGIPTRVGLAMEQLMERYPTRGYPYSRRGCSCLLIIFILI